MNTKTHVRNLWPWQLDILRGVTEHQDDAFTHRWGLFSTAVLSDEVVPRRYGEVGSNPCMWCGQVFADADSRDDHEEECDG